MSAVSLLWLSPSMFLCYLVLLKARLKIPWLCKWALRRLKKGITELRWAIHIAAGKGEAFTAEHGLGWNVALFTNSSSKQLPGFRGYWSLGVTSVIHKIKNSCFHVSQALSFVLETECDTWNATSLLYCGLWSPPHSPAIIQVVCCSCPSLWNGLCFQPLVVCENRLECFIFRTYFGCYSFRVVFSRIYIQLWKHWVMFKEMFTNIYKSVP